MYFNKVLTMISALLIGSTAFGSTMILNRTYYCTYHFSKTAWDKPVSSVIAHTGIWTKYDNVIIRPNPIEWQDIKDVQLAAKDDHFFGKGDLSGQIYVGSLQTQDKPIVQFWVTYQDGSTQILEPTFIQNLAEYHPSFYEEDAKKSQQAIEQFKSTEDANTVNCFNTLTTIH